jgi:hypothetical protein
VNPTIGCIVLLRIGGTDTHPTLRPAQVVNAMEGSPLVNLVVTLDPSNDGPTVEGFVREAPAGRNMFAFDYGEVLWEADLRGNTRLPLRLPIRLYAYSAEPGDAVGQWRWPPRT